MNNQNKKRYYDPLAVVKRSWQLSNDKLRLGWAKNCFKEQRIKFFHFCAKRPKLLAVSGQKANHADTPLLEAMCFAHRVLFLI